MSGRHIHRDSYRRFGQVLATALVMTSGLLSAVIPGGCRKKNDSAAMPPIHTITTARGVEMVLIPAGEFVMGGDGDDDEKPARRLRVAAFFMDRTEVTQDAFQSVMGTNPSRFKGGDRPVESLSWAAAVRYCNARSLKEGLKPCYDPRSLQCDFAAAGYRLPTEAEWEYACRAGAQGDFSFPAAELNNHAWFKDNAGGATHPVAQKKPNAWGLYDMQGNVAEWCQDYYSPTAYEVSPGSLAIGDNPRGPSSGETRVLRGGSWRDSAERCRSAARTAETPGLADACFGYERYGFRCVRSTASATDPNRQR